MTGAIKTLLSFQQALLFICIPIILWTVVLLQIFAHDIPCLGCWEDRGLYLLILQLLLISMLCGYSELRSLFMIFLFIIIGDDITIHQLIKHTMHLMDSAAYPPAFGVYANFLSISLPHWNLIIANLAILYICLLNYVQHKFHINQYICRTPFTRYLAIFWAEIPLVIIAYLYVIKLMA